MSESTAVEAPAAKEPFFKMSSIPGANILVPLLLGCLLNTLFPDLFKTLGSFTLGMTQQGASPLVGAFLLIVGTTISFKRSCRRCPRRHYHCCQADRGRCRVAAHPLCVQRQPVWHLGHGDAGGLHGCQQRYVRWTDGHHGQRGRAWRRRHHHAGCRPSGHDDCPWRCRPPRLAGRLGAILPIVVGIILGNLFPSFKKMMAPALSAIIVLVFFAMGSTMTFGQLINGGLPGILLGVICSVVFAIPVIAVDKLTGGTGVAGAAISSCAGANVATPAAMASVNGAMYGGAVLATATAQVAACAIVTAILTPLVTSWCYKHFEGRGNGDSKTTTDKAAATA